MGTGNRIVGWTVAFGLCLSIMLGWLAIPHAPRLDPLILVILWLNIFLVTSALGLEMGRRPYSLHLMHLISMFLSSGAASLLQYSSGTFGVPGPIDTVRRQILPAAAATTLWLMGYVTAYELRSLAVVERKARFLTQSITLPGVFALSALAMLALVYLGAAGLLGVTTRGAAEIAMLDFSQNVSARFSGTLYILTYNLARSLPPVALLAALLVFFRDPRSRRWILVPVIVVVGIGTLAVNNPFAAARMFLTCSLVAFATPFILNRFKTGWLLTGSILIGLAFLPALGTTRHLLEFREVRALFQLSSPLYYLASNPDVDSLGMAALCQQWVDRFGHRWGLQLLGAMLFWVPRAFWPGKPIATGTMVTQDLGFEFTNLAPPITAEALVDFGLIGVLLFGGVFGLVLARFDAIYWASRREGVATSYRIIDAIYPFWLVCIVYLTRGDLFSAWGFTVSYTSWILPLGLGRFAIRSMSHRAGRMLGRALPGESRRSVGQPR